MMEGRGPTTNRTAQGILILPRVVIVLAVEPIWNMEIDFSDMKTS